MKFSNRVTEMLGVEIPIIQAPMGWIAPFAPGIGRIQHRCHGHHRNILG